MTVQIYYCHVKNCMKSHVYFSVKELSTVSHVRLDRENIGFIDNLELLSSRVTNLYLQHVSMSFHYIITCALINAINTCICLPFRNTIHVVITSD